MQVLQYPVTPVLGIGVSPPNTMALAAICRQDDKAACISLPPLTRSPDDARRSNAKLVRMADDARPSLELKPLPGSMPRTEAYAVETEVLTYRHLKKAGLPVPSVIRLTRNQSTERIVSASIDRPSGFPLSSIKWSISDPRRVQVQSQIDYARSTVVRQRCRAFGSVATVAAGRGVQSWPLAFALMLEALLEDGEDHYVNIPYADIRQLLALSRQQLERVTVPQLVIPDFGKAAHVLVDKDTGSITGLLGCRDAFWGDPELSSPLTQVRIYRCYQAVKTIVVSHFRPTAVVGADLITARATLLSTLEGATAFP